MQPTKPPIGIMPRRIWRENRMRELAKTIGRRGEPGQFDSRMISLCEELAAMCRTSMVTVDEVERVDGLIVDEGPTNDG